MDILAMIRLCISTVASEVLMPDRNIIYIIFLFIIYSQYRRNADMQQSLYGRIKTPVWEMMAMTIISGLAAGFIVSIPMTLLGVAFSNDMGIVLLIPISLFLMLFSPRLICFSYSGGLLAIICLLFRIKSIDVTGILELVAILHLLEAVLIYLDGSKGAIPVFYRKSDGKVTGGFSLQKMWPIPLAVLVLSGFSSPAGDVISTPNWWPILKPPMDMSIINEAVFQLFPVTAVLGYGEFTSSCLPAEKAKDSSYKLALFSLILLLLSVLSSKIYVFKFIAALFSPLGHEFLIQYEKKAESSRESIFAPVDDGIKVMDVIPGGAAEKMGIEPGDTVLSINNRKVISMERLNSFFEQYINFIWVDVRGRNGKVRTLEYKNYDQGIDNLGILAVPENDDGLVTIVNRDGILVRFFKKHIKPRQ